MIGGKELLRPDGVEGISGIILGQGIRAHLKAEQTLDAVDILPAVQPSHRHFPPLLGKPSPRIPELSGQFGQNTGHFPFARLGFLFRRHVSRIEVVENILPMGRDGIIGQLKGQLIQPELAFLFFRTVTGYAMLFQKTPDLLRIQTNRLRRDRTK